MRIFHIATAADWERARRSGVYSTSTVGRTLEDEGFLHAAHRQQVEGVFQRYYSDLDKPLVLLTIDTDRLEVPCLEDDVGLARVRRCGRGGRGSVRPRRFRRASRCGGWR